MLGATDLIIIGFILLGGFIGFKRGFLKQGVKSLGIFIILILAFLLKNPVSVFLYEHLPFFTFGGVIKGVTVLNILVYEIIAFLFVCGILLILFKVIVLATDIFEKLLDLTIIFGAASSFLGMILGIIEYYVFAFIIILILSINTSYFENSKLSDFILTKTPIISSMTKKQYKVIDEFSDLKEKYNSSSDSNKFNLETLDLFLKYDIVDVDSVDYLISKNKLNIKGSEKLLKKYRKE